MSVVYTCTRLVCMILTVNFLVHEAYVPVESMRLLQKYTFGSGDINYTALDIGNFK